MRWMVLLLPFVVAAQDSRGPMGADKAPKVGDKAPDFKLKKLGDPKSEVQLFSFQGKRDVVLIFGSYT